jgi:hypothetical protein
MSPSLARLSAKATCGKLSIRESEMIKVLLYCSVLVVLLAGCCKSPQMPDADKIDNVEINYGAPKLIGPPDIVVTNHAAIRDALSTLRQLPSNRWHGNRMVLPVTDLTLGFNQGTNTLLVVWLSTESIGARQGGKQYKHNRWCDVPKDTVVKLKRQLGLTD